MENMLESNLRLDKLANIPLNQFYKLDSSLSATGILACTYFTSNPLAGVAVCRSDKPIKIGNFGNINFLVAANSTYSLGYLIETTKQYTTITDNSVFIGSKVATTLNAIKNVEVLYSDRYIHLMRCKFSNSFLVVPMCNLDFPRVQPLRNQISNE